MSSMQWQLGILGTISAFAYRHRETKKNLCRGDRSQEVTVTDSRITEMKTFGGKTRQAVYVQTAHFVGHTQYTVQL